jgi:hypothetical protein
MPDSVTTARGKLAALYSYGRTPDPKTADAARRALTAAKLERAVREALAATPPLLAAQRETIARLLRAGGDPA